MRILYIDIDSLRPDHLGCYGYHRPTSPNLDALAKESRLYKNVYASDVPCLPSRTALFSGRFGYHTGVVGHGGTAADMRLDGASRGFGSMIARTSFMRLLRDVGLYTASVSPFWERHAAFWFSSGFRELINTGGRGLESADEIGQEAMHWLDRKGSEDNWFLHVNFWDPHTPYRSPLIDKNPFKDFATPYWLTEEKRKAHFQQCGPHSAQESVGFKEPPDWYLEKYPNQPTSIDSSGKLRMMFDGYDCGVSFADNWVGKLIEKLKANGVYDDTLIWISGDHGENLGELNVYGDHQTADEHTCHLPCIVKVPDQKSTVDENLHYHFDIAATIVEWAGGKIANNWDGISHANNWKDHTVRSGRDYLVLSQGAWSCQRGVIFEQQDKYLYLDTLHDGLHGFDDNMLFNLSTDPHEEKNIAQKMTEHTNTATKHLFTWMKSRWLNGVKDNTALDPLLTVMQEGGPKHVRGELHDYLLRLRATGRGHWADILEKRHS